GFGGRARAEGGVGREPREPDPGRRPAVRGRAIRRGVAAVDARAPPSRRGRRAPPVRRVAATPGRARALRPPVDGRPRGPLEVESVRPGPPVRAPHPVLGPLRRARAGAQGDPVTTRAVTIDTDVLVIGSGPGRPATAAPLAAAGRGVTAVRADPMYAHRRSVTISLAAVTTRIR